MINYLPIRKILSIYNLRKQYLRSSGWLLSTKLKMPIDKYKNPLPWFTYGCIRFLNLKLKKTHTIFEYGSGNSTLWFCKHVNSVISIEHDKNWYTKMKNQFLKEPNIDYRFKSITLNDYTNEILNYKKRFHIVVIDGRKRAECCKNALEALQDNGIIIWDNSDLSIYEEGYNFLLSGGFKRLDFWGMGPINHYEWCTSIFYRKNNCFDI